MQVFRPVGGTIALVLALAASPGWAQRIQFGSPVEATPAAAAPVSPAPTITYSAAPPQAASSYAAPAAAAPVRSAVPAQPGGVVVQPGQATVAPSAAAAGGVPAYPPTVGSPVSPGASAAPSTMFQGGIQPPPSTWDPYASPGSQSPALFPQDPYFPPAAGAAAGATPMTKFFQGVRLEDYWIPGNAANELGLNDMEVTATFAWPIFYNEQTPLLITPGFGLQSWNGPKDPMFDMPPTTFDAFLQGAWNPQITPWLGGELAVRVGVWSDFDRVNVDSIRILARALADLKFSDRWTIKGGIVYLDRVETKLLPAGGVVWTPSSDLKLAIVFPDPKLAWRFTTVGNTDWWWYLRGEFGGGSWTVHRNGVFQRIDYDDVRIATGVEWATVHGWGGFFEAGVAFSRKLLFDLPDQPTFKPDSMVFVGAGITF